VHVATQCGHVDMVGLLLERGAGVNTQSKNGLACLHLAAQDDRTPIARLLTRYGANIDPQTKVCHSHIAMPFCQYVHVFLYVSAMERRPMFTLRTTLYDSAG